MGKITLTILTSFSVLLAYFMIFGVVATNALAAPSSSENRNNLQQRQIIGGNAGTAAQLRPFQVRRLRSSYAGAGGVYAGVGKMLPLQSNGRPHGSFLESGDFVVEDDDLLLDMSKKFDDYGHMRFGKRGGDGDQFDDYGHMRFGRSIEM